MAIVYVREQGTVIHKEYLQMVISKGKNKLRKIPLNCIEQLMVFGNIQITTQLMEYFLRENVEIHFFSYGGYFLGSCTGEHSRNIFLRCAQYEFFSDMEKKTSIASMLLKQKILNQLAVLRHYRGPVSDEKEWKAYQVRLKELASFMELQSSVPEMMGVEGLASNIYFKAFGQMLQSELKFTKRTRRPPKDPVNAVLSLTYTFMTRDMCSILEGHSFETYLGFLHGVRYGRKSLPLDLIEPFRQPVGDRLVLRLFNKRILSSYDFEEDAGEGIFLNQDGFQKFCYEYEKWMGSKRNGESYRNLMRNEAKSLRNLIQYGEVFEPWAWEI